MRSKMKFSVEDWQRKEQAKLSSDWLEIIYFKNFGAVGAECCFQVELLKIVIIGLYIIRKISDCGV